MEGVFAEPTASSEGESALASYEPLPMRRDVAREAGGGLRPGWYDVFESVGRHGDDVLATWRNETARISRERGLAYRPDRVDSSDRTGNWTLDPIPWVFDQDSWQKIETGIAQRVRLYAAIHADLYGGEQRIFSEKLLPPEIVLSHPGYVRAVHDLVPGPSRIGLGMVATDLAHDSTGKLFALNDRFDCPFGLGLALENRTIVNTVLPNLFRRNRVRRIGHFFVEWFEHLASSSPTHSDTPRVAILDSTPEDKDSEISFLANYCDVLRVIPSDLTVRNGQVWLKTIGGLVPLDVLWKYSAGRNLDPLETGQGFGLGVPGLFEAMRQRNISVASHPGCEVLQSPGFFPYLSRICQALLGEPIHIPPVATWWCGDEGPKRHVIANLKTMVVKSVGLHHDFSTQYGSRLSDQELYELKARIEAQPERFVAQEELMLSTVPTSSFDGLEPRGAVLRTFSFPNKAGEPQVMPGGLARVSSEEGVVVSTRTGGDSKDVWVRAREADPAVSIATELRRCSFLSPETVTSHAAENLFWVGRNAERIDLISRFVARIIEGRTLGFSHDHEDESAHESALVESLFALHESERWLSTASDADARLNLILSKSDCPVSLDRNLANFHRTTNATREQWSPAGIMAIEAIVDGWADATRHATRSFQFQSPIESLQLNLAAFLGVNLDSMTRDLGWVMLDAGRRIERGVNITNLIAFMLKRETSEAVGNLLNESVLFVSDSLGTYQTINHTEPKMPAMLRLLLGENDYPRSLMFLYHRLDQVLSKLPKPSRRQHPVELVKAGRERLEGFCARLEDDADDFEAISQYAEVELKALIKDLRGLSDHLTKCYFSHASKLVS